MPVSDLLFELRGIGPRAMFIRVGLSVCMITNRTLPQVAAVLRAFQGVADEVFVAIDSNAALDGLDVLMPLATSVVQVELPLPTIEPGLAWMFQQCTEEWILRLDGDEVASTALTDALPRLIASDLLQVHVERRWLFPDSKRFIHQDPWWPDYQTRLLRNTPIALQVVGKIHGGMIHVHPSRFVDLPIYHLERLLVDKTERASKTDDYEGMSPGLLLPNGRGINETYYYPERQGALQLSPVPSEDLERIESVLEASTSGEQSPSIGLPAASRATLGRVWDRREVLAGAYRAKLELLKPLPKSARARSVLPAVILVANLGDETWPFGSGEPAIRLSYRWFDGAGQTIDGHRTEFPHSMPPGEETIVPLQVRVPDTPGSYELHIDIVHESVRWFDAPIVAHMDVTSTRSREDSG